MTIQETIYKIKTFALKKLSGATIEINDLYEEEKEELTYPILVISPLPKHYSAKNGVVKYDYVFQYLVDDGSESTQSTLQSLLESVMALGYIDEQIIEYSSVSKGTKAQVYITATVDDAYSNVSLSEYRGGEGVTISRNKVISLNTDSVVDKLTFNTTIAQLRSEMDVKETDLKDYADKTVQIMSQEEYDSLIIKDKNVKYLIYNE